MFIHKSSIIPLYFANLVSKHETPAPLNILFKYVNLCALCHSAYFMRFHVILRYKCLLVSAYRWSKALVV